MVIMVRYTNIRKEYTPVFLHSFKVVQPVRLLDAELFNMQYRAIEDVKEIPDKLRWYRHSQGLLQSDVAEYLGMTESTYRDYEGGKIKLYPIGYLEKLAHLYKIKISELMDDYNLFIHNGQGEQVKQFRLKLGLSKPKFAKLFGTTKTVILKWERENVMMQKSSWERYQAVVNKISMDIKPL